MVCTDGRFHSHPPQHLPYGVTHPGQAKGNIFSGQFGLELYEHTGLPNHFLSAYIRK
jgi:hypothetical protein